MPEIDPPGTTIRRINVADEIRNSFLDYSMSVIVSRALPDVRDGLKPSQRRILFAMNDLNVGPARKHLKCAKIVGETMGNYHPHGDQAIYPTLVNMAQPWTMRDTLVEGQGNFGSVEGDPPASMRYTEARMTHLGAGLMEDMEKETVDFVPNYDETREEPRVFPASFPNLLVNGGTGIAVGMATTIAPHNLGEVIDGVCALIDNPQLTPEGLLQHIKGPDFPTGCQVCGTDSIRDYFSTGRGRLVVRGRIDSEEGPSGRERLVITEIPYNVNRASLEQRIADLVQHKVISDISDIRNESDESTRLVIDLKRDAIPRVVVNNLYKFTQLESSFSVNMLAIDHGRPKTLNVKEVLNCYIEHRREVIVRRTRFLLRKAEARAEILEGYLAAMSDLDQFIRIIRESSDRAEARQRMMALEWPIQAAEGFGIRIRQPREDGLYRLSLGQANAILDLRLYQLTGMEIGKVRSEYSALLEQIRDLLDILDREQRVLDIIKEQLQEVKRKHATPRLTEIVPLENEMSIEDLIANEGVIITLSHNGYIKRTAVGEYRSQRRGGKGVIGMETRARSVVEGEGSDYIEHLFAASAHDYLMFFTDTGRVFVSRVHQIPSLARASKGRSIARVLELQGEERIAALIRIESVAGEDRRDLTWETEDSLLMATQGGRIKKTRLKAFSSCHRKGIRALKIRPGDHLIGVERVAEEDEAVLVTQRGYCVRFQTRRVRNMGRISHGVIGTRMTAGDQVVRLVKVEPGSDLLVASENGFGKRTPFDEYRSINRGGLGVATMSVTGKTGTVLGALAVEESDELMLITLKGKIVRTQVSGIRRTGRVAQGVKVIALEPGDRLQAIAPVVRPEAGEDDPEE